MIVACRKAVPRRRGGQPGQSGGGSVVCTDCASRTPDARRVDGGCATSDCAEVVVAPEATTTISASRPVHRQGNTLVLGWGDGDENRLRPRDVDLVPGLQLFQGLLVLDLARI